MLDLITEPASWAAGWKHILPNHACSLAPPESTDALRLWAWWDVELGSTQPCPSSHYTQISLLNTSCALEQVRGQQTERGLFPIRNYLGHHNLTLLNPQLPLKYFWFCPYWGCFQSHPQGRAGFLGRQQGLGAAWRHTFSVQKRPKIWQYPTWHSPALLVATLQKVNCNLSSASLLAPTLLSGKNNYLATNLNTTGISPPCLYTAPRLVGHFTDFILHLVFIQHDYLSMKWVTKALGPLGVLIIILVGFVCLFVLFQHLFPRKRNSKSSVNIGHLERSSLFLFLFFFP